MKANRLHALILTAITLGILILTGCGGGHSSAHPAGDDDTNLAETDVTETDDEPGETDSDALDGDVSEKDTENDAGDEGEADSEREACICEAESTCCDGCNAISNGVECVVAGLCLENASCREGECLGQVLDCGDTNPCTEDSCRYGKECVHTPIAGCTQEDCANKVDDNGNKATDCDDVTCLADTACNGLPIGDLCAKPALINGGNGVTAALIGQTLSYTGDTSLLLDHYRSSFCAVDLGAVPDAAYRLKLDVPLWVTATHRFVSSGDILSPVLAVYSDLCHPDTEFACDTQNEAPAVISRVFAPGVYYFVVDGASAAHADWGAYEFTLQFAALPAHETNCTDEIDEDQDRSTDCRDSDCSADAACGDCLTNGSLQCGKTVSGVLPDAPAVHYYDFTTDKAANVSLTMTMIDGGAYETLNVNFKEAREQVTCEELYGVSGEVWHTTNPNAAGFAAAAGKRYVARLHASNFSSGRYTLSFQCNTEPESACDDTNDNDFDTYTDCEDPDCYSSADCTGGNRGENCADPYRINDGASIGASALVDGRLERTYFNTTENRLNDLGAACNAASSYGPDTVYTFTLSETMQADIGLTPRDLTAFQVPALILFQGSCGGPTAVCGETYFTFSTLSAVLPAGTYFVVADSGAIGTDGLPDRYEYELSLVFSLPPASEDCDDKTDNDSDGYTDCLDEQCFFDSACTGGHDGENCSNAYPVNGGAALATSQLYTVANTTIGRRNDLRAGCVSVAFDGPDTVHRIVLASPADLRATVVFENGMTPSLALFKAETCDSQNAIACQLGETDSAMVEARVEAGVYHLVVDSGGLFFSDVMRSTYQLHIQADPPSSKRGIRP